MHDVKFSIDRHGCGDLSVDGVELQNFVRGFELKSRVGEPAELVIELPAFAIDGQVAIELRKLGIMNDTKLELTTEKPTKPGWYWWRKCLGDQPQVVRVRWWLGYETRDSEDDHLRAYRTEQFDGEYDNQLESFIGEWAGPMEPPV